MHHCCILLSYYTAFKLAQRHFADLLGRYSSPCLVLDLVKQTEKREREVIVGTEYRKAIEHVNSTMPQVSCETACSVTSFRSVYDAMMRLLRTLSCTHREACCAVMLWKVVDALLGSFLCEVVLHTSQMLLRVHCVGKLYTLLVKCSTYECL
jgi:SacI homology domain